jgi:DNA invertase Pin-like site-specific DNA recombinase
VRLVAYCRVSTNGQALAGTSIPQQEEDTRAWCVEHGHELVGVHAESGGVSGAEGLEGRFAFIEALDAVKRGDADGIVVRDLDRLSRDVVVQESLLRDVWAAGGHAFSTRAAESEQLVDDPADPTRKLVRVVLGAIAEWEREKIRLRLQSARRAKAERGGYVGGDRLHRRYGYSLERDDAGTLDYVPEPGEQAVIAEMHELRNAGATLARIADELTLASTPAPSGHRWHPATIKRVLDREAGR